MEKKTIGQFIAALRKASGMTQKELAQKLNVSDKAVSRWERDECAPDLSLIPVIADIFGVTSDELLRGERRAKAPDNEASADANGQPLSAKSQKQLQYMIKKSLIQFRVQCLIAGGIAVVSIIVAMICNALSEALIGFFVGLVLMVGAVICLIAFGILASSKGHDEQLEETTAKRYQKSVICTTYWVFGGMWVGFVAFLLPLMIGVEQPHFGLAWSYMSNVVAGNALISTVIWLAGRLFLQSVLVKRNLAEVPPALRRNRTLIIKTLGVLAGAMAATWLGLLIVDAYVDSAMPFSQGIKFDNYTAFKEYMETPMDGTSDGYIILTDEEFVSYTDQYPLGEIRNSRGELLVSYTHKNQSVVCIVYGDSEDCLPITVYNMDDFNKNNDMMGYIVYLFVAVYVLEIAGAIAFYVIKRQR